MENKTIKTKNGHEAIVKADMTAGDFRQLKSEWFKDLQMEATGAKDADVKITGMKGTTIEDVENKAIELMVVSLDGSSENILKRLLDLPVADYSDILEAVREATQDFAQKKIV